MLILPFVSPKSRTAMRRFNCQVILITALWPRRPQYTDLLQLAIAIPNIQNGLQQPNTEIYNPNLEALQLTAWLLSIQRNGFSRNTRVLPTVS